MSLVFKEFSSDVYNAFGGVQQVLFGAAEPSGSVVPWGQCCVRVSLYRGTTAEHAVEFVGQSHKGVSCV